MTDALELTKSPPAWGLPSATPPQIAVELYLRVCGLPYTTTLSPYPYSTCTGRSQPLPVLRDRHLASSPAPLCLAFLAQQHCDLDQRRTPQERALITALTSLLLSLDDLLELALHSPSSPYLTALSSHASSLTLPHALYLRRQRRAHADTLSKDRGFTSSPPITATIRRTLDAFDTLLAASPHPFLLSPRPSSIDVLLASYVAYMHRLPTDLRSPRIHSPSTSPSTSLSSPPPPPPEPSLADLVHERPLLWAHSAFMLSTFFPAYASLPPSSSPLSPSLTAYHQRWQHLSLSLSSPPPQTGLPNGHRPLVPVVEGEGSAVEAPPDVKAASERVAALAVRKGDVWQAELQAQLTEEERRARAVRHNRMWIIAGAVAVFAFALRQRQQHTSHPSAEIGTVQP